MPELPEVETIRRQLAKTISGRRLAGKKITGVRRRAKILIVDFQDGSSLLFHLKLTGQLIFQGEPGKHTRRIFRFDDGTRLIFNDLRKFGWWKKTKSTKDLEKSFGPEADKISFGDFKKIIGRRPKAKIKQLLLDQKAIAGIGNIYSDEILFASKVHPLRRAKSLNEEEIKRLWQNTLKILKRAILMRGTSERDYLDVFGRKGDYLKQLKVYRKTGEKCPRCGTRVKRIKTGGRSAHFCPKCQKI